MSSYGPVYGMLRQNEDILYISDLVNWHEYAFDLSRDPIGTPMAITDDLRRLNQRLILGRVADVNTFFGRSPGN
jgi:hypothetical protein